jgi:transposase
MGYFDMLLRLKDPRLYRLKVVQHAKEHGVKPTARKFNSSAQTVRKWMKRWEPGSLHGLEDRSKAPKNPKTYITEEQKELVIKLKKRFPSFGSQRIKDQFHLPISEKAIRKIWKEEGLLKTKRRKHKTKQDLREIKEKWNLFEQISIDTKELIDIPEYWPQIKALRLPKVQYTARDVVSGTHFIAFADEKALCYASLFAEMVLSHLSACRVRFKNSRAQTDNGSEFIGSWNAKDDSLFTRTVSSFKGITHTTIPAGAHTWQADVETVHRLIEDEFYEVEKFENRKDFLMKASAYILWFNLARKNSYKKNKTPWQIIQERNPKSNPNIPILLPVFLNEAYKKKILSGGNHVVLDPFLRIHCGKRNTHGYPLIKLNIMRVDEFDLVVRHIQSSFVLKNHRTSNWFLKLRHFSNNFKPWDTSTCFYD